MQLLAEEDLTPAAFAPYCALRWLTRRSLKKLSLAHDNILEEIPVVIHNTHLLRALLVELEADLEQQPEVAVCCALLCLTVRQARSRLDLPTHTFLEKNIQYLMDCVEDLSTSVLPSKISSAHVPQRDAKVPGFPKGAGQGADGRAAVYAAEGLSRVHRRRC